MSLLDILIILNILNIAFEIINRDFQKQPPKVFYVKRRS